MSDFRYERDDDFSLVVTSIVTGISLCLFSWAMGAGLPWYLCWFLGSMTVAPWVGLMMHRMGE